MSYVYILQSKTDNKFYIGSTNNLERRLEEHNRGQTKSTKFRRPFALVFYQEYKNIQVAKKIESKLKRFKNKSIIDRIIADQIIRLRS
ncbi:MAG: GIY-YIG nuclease family protein [Patescibacteria group bacterium]|jgi:putative endonuclease